MSKENHAFEIEEASPVVAIKMVRIEVTLTIMYKWIALNLY